MKKAAVPLYAALCLLAAGLLLSGCRNQKVAQAETREAPSADRRVEMQGDLSNWLRVDEIVTAKENGLLKVQAQVRNTFSKTLDVEYRFVWRDAAGLEVESPASRWILKNIKGRDMELVSAIAPSDRAVDYIFKLKRR